jgi:hypothetical protein
VPFKKACQLTSGLSFITYGKKFKRSFEGSHMSEQEILHELKALSQKVDYLVSFIESTRAE